MFTGNLYVPLNFIPVRLLSEDNLQGGITGYKGFKHFLFWFGFGFWQQGMEKSMFTKQHSIHLSKLYYLSVKRSQHS